MQLYTAEQKKYLALIAERHNKLYSRGASSAQTCETLQYYRGIIAGLQVGKRKLYKLDVKTDLYINIGTDLCPAQAKFAAAFPGKAIDCDIPAHVDIDRLISAMQQSTWLRLKNNITLASCIELYGNIIAGKYKDYKAQPTCKDFMRHQYSAVELDAMFMRSEEFEV